MLGLEGLFVCLFLVPACNVLYSCSGGRGAFCT